MTRRFSKRSPGMRLTVRPRMDDRRKGWLAGGNFRFPCALGRSGTTRAKREGDGATPVTALRPGQVHWRADKLARPRTALSSRPLRTTDGWCDDPGHRRYNRRIALPFSASHERMWREDDLYDVVVELDWNMRPAVKGRGSAIFMHVARPGYEPTEGCIALRRDHLLRLLATLCRDASVTIMS